MGFAPDTGVAGVTLVGDFGYLTRRFGWTVDNLEELEIVTAEGATTVASRSQHPDLFWAVRGGGGTFGVVTRFSYRIHRLGPLVTGGLIAWDATRLTEVLVTYQHLVASAPPELTVALAVISAPPTPFVPVEWHGKPVVGMVVCHSGDDAETDLAPVRALGDPVLDLVGEMPYLAQQALLDQMQHDGLNQYWKAEHLSELTTEYLEVFRQGAVEVTSPLSYSIIFPIGGALNALADDDGAVGNRDARFISGNYVNFQLADDDDARTAGAYRGNLERPAEVKAASTRRTSSG